MQNPAYSAILSERALEALGSLCRRYRVRDLALFGSAAGGEFDPERSDIDILAEFEPMQPAEHMKSYFGLLEDLEELFGRRVDLVEIDSIRNPYVLASVLRNRVDLYAAP